MNNKFSQTRRRLEVREMEMYSNVMKKIFICVVIYFLTFTPSISDTHSYSEENRITIKGTPGYEIYDQYIENLLNYTKEFNLYVNKYCEDQLVSGAGLEQYIEKANCEYDSAVDLLSKHNLNQKPMSDITFAWYKKSYGKIKNTVKAMKNCKDDNCWNNTFRMYRTSEHQYLLEYIRNLQDAVELKAIQSNQEYYANKNNNEDSWLNISDDEIIPAASGSGFYISMNGHVVTNYHVIEGCTEVVTAYNGNEYKNKILAVDRKNDLAIIHSKIENDHAYSVSKIDPQLLDEVIVAGFPLGKKISASIKATTGSVTALSGQGDNYSEFQIDAALNSGNSGGPIINKKGNVIGVAVSKLVEEGIDSFNFGIKSSVLEAFANSNEIKFIPPNDKIMKRSDLGNLISKATVYIDCWMSGKDLKKILTENKQTQKAFYNKFK